MKIVLYDNDCGMCSELVQFIIRNDSKANISFAALQSEKGKELLKRNHIPEDTDSVVFVEDEVAYIKSTASLKIAKALDGVWKMNYGFVLVPKFLRDGVYDVVAKHRHKFFKKNACQLVQPEQRKRFID